MLWRTTWLRAERWESGTQQAGRPVSGVNAGRSQSPNSTAHGEEGCAVEKCVRPKDASGKWGRKVDSQRPDRAEMKVEASPVSETTRRDASVLGSCMQRKFVPAPIWTEAMLAALQTGVKEAKGYRTVAVHSSLILGFSRCPKPINWRANPDEETTDWRARRGRTAHRVRREGTVKAVSYPYPTAKWRQSPVSNKCLVNPEKQSFRDRQ